MKNRSDPYTLALIQMRCGQDPEENLRRAGNFVKEAAARGARIVCLPELFRSVYFCQQEDPALFGLAESIPGPTTEALGKIAREQGVWILASIFERRAAGLYHNSLALINPDGHIVGLYRKTHVPDDPAYYEKYYFTPGDLGFQAFDTPMGRIGTLICWDQWYPEAARLTALRGAEVLFYPTAIGWHPHEKEAYGAQQLDAWRTMQRGHAIANGVYVAAVNRIGHEIPRTGGAGIEFWGHSFVADPFGLVIAEASENSEEILFAEINPRQIEEVRRHWPFLRDRRIDLYGNITQRFLDVEP